MSRRHHGRPHHRAAGAADRPRPSVSTTPAAGASPDAVPGTRGAPEAARPPATAASEAHAPVDAPNAVPTPVPPPAMAAAAPPAPVPPVDRPPASPVGTSFVPHADARHAPPTNGAAGPIPGPMNGNQDRNGQCTAPQLRRFIKSRPYVPMHELRRRFGINGDDDDVTPVRLEPGWVYVGLPSREGMLLGELLRAGEIGYELSLDPRSPIVIGVYPMRPIPRG